MIVCCNPECGEELESVDESVEEYCSWDCLWAHEEE